MTEAPTTEKGPGNGTEARKEVGWTEVMEKSTSKSPAMTSQTQDIHNKNGFDPLVLEGSMHYSLPKQGHEQGQCRTSRGSEL